MGKLGRRVVSFALLLSVLLGNGSPALQPAASAQPLPGRASASSPAAFTADSCPTSTATVDVTASGFSPSSLTIVAGTLVTWCNQTSAPVVLQGGSVYHVYLPFVADQTASGAAADTAPRSGDVDASAVTFGATIQPGQTYAFTFAQAGTYPYFLDTDLRFSGQVVVQPPTLPPDPASVAPPPDNSVATSVVSSTQFLYTGTSPIQTGVAPGTIQLQRAAVLRGRVLDASNNPRSGVAIAILNHPALGQTLTRADGRFDLAMNSGGPLVVTYALKGYLPAQRQLTVTWQDYVADPDVVLLVADPNVSLIDTSGNAASLQVARGSLSSDASGSRQATMLVPPGTSASLVFPNGQTQPVSALHVRATEYTIGTNGPAAMPAQLPDLTGYTYAVEFSADEEAASGASGVQFSQPIAEYTENFLGFTVGAPVPVGTYDPTTGTWVPSPNGLVVKILGVSNGEVSLDVDGTGVAATTQEYQELGITDAERKRLAVLYSTGQSLWRVLLSHFSGWDYNLGDAPPDGATDPKPPKPTATAMQPPCNCPCGCQKQKKEMKAASTIDRQTRAFGEDVAIVGTGLGLHYQSDRQAGDTAANVITIPLTGATLPPGLTRVDLTVQVAGESFSYSFAPAPNLSYTFTWDGKNAYGQTVQGSQTIGGRITYAYPATYLDPPRATSLAAKAAVFGHYTYDGRPISVNTTRTEFDLRQNWQTTIGAWRAATSVGLGGWDVGMHHAYDPVAHVLFQGDGSQRDTGAVVATISTVVGSAGAGFAGDGGPAGQASLNNPEGIAFAADGSLYIADYGNCRIRKIDPNGAIATIAGEGRCSHGGDGGPAAQATLGGPASLAFGPDGSLYVGEYSNYVRKIDPSGTITTVAGTGTAGDTGDGGPATSAEIAAPSGIAVDHDGKVYFSDPNDSIVRMVDWAGIITTAAGGGPCCERGDGGPATRARLATPGNLAVGSHGDLFIGDA